MPIPAAVPLALQGISLLGGLFGGNKAKKRAERERKRIAQENAYNTLVNVAAGGGPAPQQPLPQVPEGPGFFDVVGGVGSLLGQYGTMQREQARQSIGDIINAAGKGLPVDTSQLDPGMFETAGLPFNVEDVNRFAESQRTTASRDLALSEFSSGLKAAQQGLYLPLPEEAADVLGVPTNVFEETASRFAQVQEAKISKSLIGAAETGDWNRIKGQVYDTMSVGELKSLAGGKAMVAANLAEKIGSDNPLVKAILAGPELPKEVREGAVEQLQKREARGSIQEFLGTREGQFFFYGGNVPSAGAGAGAGPMNPLGLRPPER